MQAESTHYKDPDGVIWRVEGSGTHLVEGYREVFLYNKQGDGPKRVVFQEGEWDMDKPLDMESKGFTAVDGFKERDKGKA